MKHYLESFDNDADFLILDSFDKEKIKEGIISHLTKNPTDNVVHRKDFSGERAKKYAGKEFINMYCINPLSGEFCLYIFKGHREYYKKLDWSKPEIVATV